MTTVRIPAGRAVPDRVLYDAIDHAIRLMAAHLDQALTPAHRDALDADDREAIRTLLENRLEPRFLALSRPAA